MRKRTEKGLKRRKRNDYRREKAAEVDYIIEGRKDGV